MKRIAAATALSLALVSGTAHAGGMAPVLEPAVIVEDTTSSAGGILVPIFALILFAAALHD